MSRGKFIYDSSLELINCKISVSNGKSFDNTQSTIYRLVADEGSVFTTNTIWNVRYEYDPKYGLEPVTFNYRMSEGQTRYELDILNAPDSYNRLSKVVFFGRTEAKGGKPTVTIKGDFNNCSCNYVNGEEISKTKNLIITANSGYKWVGDFKYYIDNQPYSFEQTETTLTINMANIDKPISINMLNIIPTLKLGKVKLTGNFTGCKCSYTNNEEIQNATEKPIVINSDDLDSKLNYPMYADVGGVKRELIKVSDFVARLNYTSSDIGKDVDFKYSYTTKTSGLVISGSFINCTCNYKQGDKLELGKPITITANEGYDFKEQFTCLNTATGLQLKFTGDNKVRTLDIDKYLDVVIDLNMIYTAYKETPSVSNFINIYKIDNKTLDKLSSKRFKPKPQSETGVDLPNDFGNFIMALYHTDFEIPTKYIDSPRNIILGDLDTGIKGDIINSEVIDIDFGKINFDVTDYLDYTNSKYILNTPLYKPMTLDTEHIINGNIGLDYTVNLVNNNITLNLNSDGVVLDSLTGKFGRSVPYIQFSDRHITKDGDNVLDNVKYFKTETGYKSYISKYRKEPIPTINSYSELKNIGNLKGYYKLDDVSIKSKATSTEKDLIRQILGNGVYL